MEVVNRLIFIFGHFLSIQLIVMNEKDRMKPPIQSEVIRSSMPRNLEIPKPAITVTVQTGHIEIIISVFYSLYNYQLTPPHGGVIMSVMTSHIQFKNEAINRIKTAQGHLEKVRKMLEDEEYCPDVIHQNRAVQAALKKVDELVLHGHLHSCVLKDVHGEGSEKMVSEIVDLFSKNE